MKQNDYYFCENFDATDKEVLHRIAKMFTQMQARPSGVYLITRWPTLRFVRDMAARSGEGDSVVASLEAAMSYIAPGHTSGNTALFESGVLENVYRAQGSVEPQISGSPDRDEAHGPRLPSFRGWHRAWQFLFDSGRWSRGWRAACRLFRKGNRGGEETQPEEGDEIPLIQFLEGYQEDNGISDDRMRDIFAIYLRRRTCG